MLNKLYAWGLLDKSQLKDNTEKRKLDFKTARMKIVHLKKINTEYPTM